MKTLPAFALSASFVLLGGTAPLRSSAQSLLAILAPYGITAADEVLSGSPPFQETFVFAPNGFSTLTKLYVSEGVPALVAFGTYDPAAPSNHTPLWTNDLPDGTTAFVVGTVGLYLDNQDPAHQPGGGRENAGLGGTFYSQQSLNFDGFAHIRQFRKGSELFLGWEDLSLPLADGDDNDLVVRLAAVPEPGNCALLVGIGIGASSLFTLRRRRK